MSPPMIFRARWPIHHHAPHTDLVDQAAADLPTLIRQAHARLTGPGRFTIARSQHVPGSGRITEWVLIYEAPAAPRQGSR